MDKHSLLELSEEISQIAQKAEESVMDIYLKQKITHKTKVDGSPLTEADLSSHRLIIERLNKINLNLPVLSEEGKAAFKKDIKAFWLVDPLDGTKEFLNKNGDFTINIALIENGVPLLGVVNAPAKDEIFTGISGVGAYKIVEGRLFEITTKKINIENLRVTLSRSHQTEKDVRFLEVLTGTFKKVEVIEAGSSLKLCRVAEGQSDIYCRMGPTFQWDIASGQAVLEAAGGELRNLRGESFQYSFNSKKKNPEFYSVGDPTYPWANLFS